MTQRHDDSSEHGPRQNRDEEVHGLVTAPEPTWHITEEGQARLDRIFAAGRRLWEQMERTSPPVADRNHTRGSADTPTAG